MRCREEDAEAPRVGCGCTECFRARERSLDPRLAELARPDYERGFPKMNPSRDVVYRCLMEYLWGRIDYGALHVGIIKALMDLADRHFEQTMLLASLQPTPPFSGLIGGVPEDKP